MRRSLWWTLPLAVVGVVLGAVATLAARPAPLATIEAVTPTATPSSPAAPGPLTEIPLTKMETGVVLTWTPGGLPDGLADAVASIAQVRDVTVVYGDRVDLVASTDVDGRPVDSAEAGWAWPLDALAIDPDGYASFTPKAIAHVIADLSDGRAVLGSTSAELRRLGAGASLTLAGGTELEVAAVVDDTAVAAAELVVDVETGRDIGVTTPRFLLIAYDGDRASVDEAIRVLMPDSVAIRVRAPGETPFLRHGDAVLPQALIKQRFGEFAFRPPAPGEQEFRQEPGWAARNLVTVELPLIGSARCHRVVVESLRGALAELDAEGLDHLVDAAGFAGCHNPRLIGPEGAVSRHAWGAAVDLNAGLNPTGTGSGQDPRLVKTFARWGFTWGGFWLVPDPMHFEYLRSPDAVTSDG